MFRQTFTDQLTSLNPPLLSFNPCTLSVSRWMMMDQVWLVNAPVSTADARNLLLSFPTLLSDFLSMPSVFLPIFVTEDFVYASRMSQDSLIFSHLQLLEFHCSALRGIDLALLQPTDVSVYFQRNFIGLLLLIFSPAAVFSMSNLSIILSFTTKPTQEFILSHVTIYGK